MITPRTLKGFRDFLPEVMIPRERLLEAATQVYRSYGFAPIDTPVLEYLEILQGKGSEETDKQLYKFEDHGGRKVGMRFDLTVPLARFSAQHFAELGIPFKRYHLAKVWRGENTQAGRYREFTQCDFDTIGTRSLVSDIEATLIINDLMERIDLKSGKPFTRFKIRINNRMVLTGLLEKEGLIEKSTLVLRALDKIAKVGRENVMKELTETAGTTPAQAEAVLRLAELRGSNDEILVSLEKMLAGNSRGEEGVCKLSELTKAVHAAGIPADRLVIDVSIARGLEYYTGTIYETFLDELPEIGSVYSGGRYDNLAGLYTKQELPGVGASLGLDRLIAAMETLGMIEKISTPIRVFLPYFVENRLCDYLNLAALIRKSGIGIELYPEPKKLGQQLKYADRRGFHFAIILGEEEFEKNLCRLKDLRTGTSVECPLDGIVEALRKKLD